MEKGNDIKTNSQKAIEELKEAINEYRKKDKPFKNNSMKKFLIFLGLIVLVTFSLIAQVWYLIYQDKLIPNTI